MALNALSDALDAYEGPIQAWFQNMVVPSALYDTRHHIVRPRNSVSDTHYSFEIPATGGLEIILFHEHEVEVQVALERTGPGKNIPGGYTFPEPNAKVA